MQLSVVLGYQQRSGYQGNVSINNGAKNVFHSCERIFSLKVMSHNLSVFANSCLRVPVDPISKMPKSAYERKTKPVEQCSVDSLSTIGSVSAINVDTHRVKDFFLSIPDYNDINHLPPEEFYSTLKILREKKRTMMGNALNDIDGINMHDANAEGRNTYHVTNKIVKSKRNQRLGRKCSAESSHVTTTKTNVQTNMANVSSNLPADLVGKTIERRPRKSNFTDSNDEVRASNELRKSESKPKRNHSACSITWDDQNWSREIEIDQKFDKFFEGKNYFKTLGDDFKTQSMPSSPLRSSRLRSPLRKRRSSSTVPKPFKMTERDEDERVVTELRSLRKSLSDDMLHQKRDRKRFRARPVPIESRIPLYDKMLEDQAMRRAIAKINSEAELRAQMKPFNFTKREEKSLKTGFCEKVLQGGPRPKKKRFRAKPVPKHLFSNYIYGRAKQDDFFRTFNRRIRAEEMLRNASLPGNMATRERSRLSTPAAHSDLPTDPSPLVPSVTSSGFRTVSPSKEPKRREKTRHDFVTTSPQPFRLTTAERAAKKVIRDMEELRSRMTEGGGSSAARAGAAAAESGRVLSALELRAHATGRSNLAALLRAEAVRRRFESEAAMRQADHRRRIDIRTRDRLLRTNPSWQLVKNNHEEDIAMRLQTRRDEERMRREEFLHEMELMYGRVQQQPMLFERYYAPRPSPLVTMTNSIQLSPRKSRRSSKNYRDSSPHRSRNVSINDTTKELEDVEDYFNRIDMLNEKYSDSDAPLGGSEK